MQKPGIPFLSPVVAENGEMSVVEIRDLAKYAGSGNYRRPVP
jgi:hypothetical protein